MIGSSERQVRPPDAEAARPKLVECLRGGHLVNQVKIDEDYRRGICFRNNDVRFPDFVV